MPNTGRKLTPSSPRRSLRLRVVALLTVAMLALPALAAAQSSPTNDQYGDIPNCVEGSGSAAANSADCVLTGAGGGSADPSDPSDPGGLGGNVGPLPFTGFDVIAMVAVALAVTGAGLALQRAVARQSE
jgi:hypothetical protein